MRNRRISASDLHILKVMNDERIEHRMLTSANKKRRLLVRSLSSNKRIMESWNFVVKEISISIILAYIADVSVLTNPVICEHCL